jgi:DNA-binding FadR family transcriptional regulator
VNTLGELSTKNSAVKFIRKNEIRYTLEREAAQLATIRWNEEDIKEVRKAYSSVSSCSRSLRKGKLMKNLSSSCIK